MSQNLFKSESHVFEVNRRRILFDVLRGGFFEVDDVARDTLAKCDGQAPHEIVEDLKGRHRPEEVRAVLEELEQAEILTGAPCRVAPFHPPSRIEISHLSLCVTRDKPEKRSRVTSHESRVQSQKAGQLTRDPVDHWRGGPAALDSGLRTLYMSEAVALAALDFLFRASGALQDCEVSFEGGDPLLNVPLLRRIIAYGEERAEDLGKRIGFEVVTDGALLTGRVVDYFVEKGVALVLEFAPDNDPRGIEQVASLLRKSHLVERLHLRVVADRRCLDLAERIEVLARLFPSAVSIGVRWASLPSGHPHALRAEDVEGMRDSLAKLGDCTVRHLLGRGETVLEEIEGPMAQLQERQVLLYSCGAGSRSLAVSPEGDLFPCFDLIGWASLRAGDVFSGIDAERYRRGLQDLHVERRTPCRACWARYLCGGGCCADAALTTGDPAAPNPVSCERIRRAYELAMAACLEVETRAPGLLAGRYLAVPTAPTGDEGSDEYPVLERYA